LNLKRYSYINKNRISPAQYTHYKTNCMPEQELYRSTNAQLLKMSTIKNCAP